MNKEDYKNFIIRMSEADGNIYYYSGVVTCKDIIKALILEFIRKNQIDKITIESVKKSEVYDFILATREVEYINPQVNLEFLLERILDMKTPNMKGDYETNKVKLTRMKGILLAILLELHPELKNAFIDQYSDKEFFDKLPVEFILDNLELFADHGYLEYLLSIHPELEMNDSFKLQVLTSGYEIIDQNVVNHNTLITLTDFGYPGNLDFHVYPERKAKVKKTLNNSSYEEIEKFPALFEIPYIIKNYKTEDLDKVKFLLDLLRRDPNDPKANPISMYDQVFRNCWFHSGWKSNPIYKIIPPDLPDDVFEKLIYSRIISFGIQDVIMFIAENNPDVKKIESNKIEYDFTKKTKGLEKYLNEYGSLYDVIKSSPFGENKIKMLIESFGEYHSFKESELNTYIYMLKQIPACTFSRFFDRTETKYFLFVDSLYTVIVTNSKELSSPKIKHQFVVDSLNNNICLNYPFYQNKIKNTGTCVITDSEVSLDVTSINGKKTTSLKTNFSEFILEEKDSFRPWKIYKVPDENLYVRIYRDSCTHDIINQLANSYAGTRTGFHASESLIAINTLVDNNLRILRARRFYNF